MKIINLEQGTKEWLSWRKTVITATDASAILGSNPWVTPYKCWQRKLGLVEEQVSNAAMERGKRLEPIARQQFINETNIHMEPVVVESTDISYLGASLDGMSEQTNTILEIKCGGSDLHSMAMHGIIPDYYMAQMQHQLIVTRATKCYYYSYFEGNGACMEVLPDPAFEEKYMVKAREFWKGIACFEAPPLSKGDYKDMNDNLSWNEYAKMYQEMDAAIKAQEDRKDYLRKKLIEMCGDQSCQGSGLKVMKMLTKGRIAYDEIPEIKGIDIEKYRKASVCSWKFLVENADGIKK